MKEELFLNYKELRSERLLLRKLTNQDISDVFEIYSDPEVMLYFDDRYAFKDIAEAAQMINDYDNAIRSKNGMRWGIVLKESGKIIGTCGFHAISDYHKRIEIGYDLNRNYWRKGIMSEALPLIIDYAFEHSEVNRIEAFIEPPNKASRALLGKLGFRMEGTLREHEMCRGKLTDIQVLSLLRKEWEAADKRHNRMKTDRMEIRQIDQANRDQVNAFIVQQWYTMQMVVHGENIDMHDAEGYYVCEDDEIIGLITYRIAGKEMEILSLDSLRERRGIGTGLLDTVVAKARETGVQKIVLITTNDNLPALRFYQKRGFSMSRLSCNALDQARKIKPEIPLTGMDGIPLKHEIELEMIL